MPPAKARNVTSMLFVKIWLEIAARSGEDSSVFGAVGPRLGHRPVGRRHEPGRAAGVSPRPPGREEGRPEEEHSREEQGELSLDDQAPVVVLDEAPERAAPRGSVVDDMPGAVDQALQVRDRRIAREAPAGEREICRRTAVPPAEQEDTRRAELLRPPPGTAEERLELLPRGAALA